jgi:hypothetical protein
MATTNAASMMSNKNKRVQPLTLQHLRRHTTSAQHPVQCDDDLGSTSSDADSCRTRVPGWRNGKRGARMHERLQPKTTVHSAVRPPAVIMSPCSLLPLSLLLRECFSAALFFGSEPGCLRRRGSLPTLKRGEAHRQLVSETQPASSARVALAAVCLPLSRIRSCFARKLSRKASWRGPFPSFYYMLCVFVLDVCLNFAYAAETPACNVHPLIHALAALAEVLDDRAIAKEVFVKTRETKK